MPAFDAEAFEAGVSSVLDVLMALALVTGLSAGASLWASAGAAKHSESPVIARPYR
ncbi:hypothetical protein SAJA_08850 [Salinisphaera japonica YTM-1]|uniref:Uncharacterized protein n=1 Tax=Salinisphaera japonica YTM-1 TaxID=1209778 RepID=A0A423PQV1_9GAMM|nr:hypothetical protein SAJA_08850 [Salinisphaera japonica YTM-1]